MDNKAKSGYVCYPVLQELDRLKMSDGLKGKQARDAVHRIYKDPDLFPFIFKETEKDEKVDDFLLRLAEEDSLTLATLDLSLLLKAKSKGVSIKYSHNGEDHYGGATYLDDEVWCSILENRFEGEYPENHFLIYGEEARVIKNGIPVKVDRPTFNSTHCGSIKPRNVEQACLMNLLLSDVPVVAGTGKPGSGKSHLMLNYALTQLDRGNINKLVFVPANAFVKDSFDIGALPGGLFEKQEHMLGPLIDIVGIDRIMDLVESDRIEVLPVAVLRGRSFSNSILYCSEAQNLSEDHMQLLVSRLGDGSKLLVDGDYQGQIDKRVFENKNGIRLLFNLAKTEDAELFGTVALTKIERSRVAQLAEVLADFR